MLLSSVLALCLALQVSGQSRLIWEDNFDTLDETKWRHTITGWDGGNGEFQYYRNNRKNSYVQDGILNIQPTPSSDELSDWDMRYGIQYDSDCNKEPCIIYGDPEGNTLKPVFSARLHTQETFTMTYGRIEVRAKVPRGDWIWPSVWLLPYNDTYGSWPVSGELDFIESRGNKGLLDTATGYYEGVQATRFGIYYKDTEDNNASLTSTVFIPAGEDGDFSQDFHVYEIERSEKGIKFTVDNQSISWSPSSDGLWNGNPNNNPYANGTNIAPFDQPFYLIMNVAVGGTAFNPKFNNSNGWPWSLDSGRPWAQFYEAQPSILSTWESPALQVDYVRVYEL